MRTVYDVTAKLECGHEVVERGLSKAKSAATETTMRVSAFCATCGRFQPTKIEKNQPRVWAQSRKDF